MFLFDYFDRRIKTRQMKLSYLYRGLPMTHLDQARDFCVIRDKFWHSRLVGQS